MYKARWTGAFETIYPFAERHTYENRIRVSDSVFNFGTPDPKIVEAFPRPTDTNDYSPIKGFGIEVGHWDMSDQMLMRRTNALLAPTHEVSNFVYLFNAREYSDDIAGQINTAWKGPNKNELVAFIGLDPATKKVEWASVTSWCDDTTVHAVMRQRLFDMGTYSPEAVASIIREVVPKHWKRKQFADFAYIEIDTPMAAYIAVCVITLVITLIAVAATEIMSKQR
ncbi:MAG: hypothetical protein HC888_02555 [Candidatus Competibacteraceae bacterium]|nr:hypothetical protein [Candidatus Competibacteraceae bacterium]